VESREDILRNTQWLNSASDGGGVPWVLVLDKSASGSVLGLE
jgi:hypothetical protein